MVVDEFKTTQGVHIRILDDAFRGQTDEERERIVREARRCAWRIAEAKAARQRAEKDPSLCSLGRKERAPSAYPAGICGASE